MIDALRLSRRRRAANWLRDKAWWFAAGGIVMLAVWVVLLQQLLLAVPAWRVELEQMLEARIGTAIEIGSVSGHVSGLSPVFVLEDVRLPGVEGGPPGLHLGRVALAVDVLPSLLNRSLRARSLWLDGLAIELLMDEQGRLTLAGIDALGSQVADAAPPMEQLLRVLYRQKRIRITDVSATLSHADETLKLDRLTLSMTSSGARHRLALLARGDEAGLSADIRLDWRGDAYQLGQFNGDAYLDLHLDGLDPVWLTRWPYSVRPTALSGQAQAWLTVRGGEVSEARLQTDIAELTLSGGQWQGPWPLQGIAARAALRRQGLGYRLELAELALADGDWRSGPLTLLYDQQGEQDWLLLLHDMPLAGVAELFASAPWRAEESRAEQSQAGPTALSLAARLTIHQPQGRIDYARIAGQGKQVSGINARFEGLGWQAEGALPGVSGLSGWLAGDVSSGWAQLDSDGFVLDMPTQLPQPVSAALRGPLHWQRAGDTLQVDAGWLQLSNTDARGRALARLLLPADASPELSLLATFVDIEGRHMMRYVPRQRLGEGAEDWFSQAFVAGTLEQGVIVHQGPLVIDPQRQQDRTLQMQFQASDLSISFLPDWPPLEGLAARITLDGREIRGRNISAQLMGSEISMASVDVPGWQAGQVPRLTVSGRLRGPASTLQQLLHDTPLSASLPADLHDWQASEGEYKAHMMLQWPLGPDQQPGMVRAIGAVNDLGLSGPLDIRVDDLAGDVLFDLASGIQMRALRGTVLGETVAGSMVTRDGWVAIDWHGRARAEALQQWLDFSWLAPAYGAAGYQARVRLPWGQPGAVQFAVQSDLQGFGLALPAPLRKPASTQQPMALSLTVQPQGVAMQVEYRPLLGASLVMRERALHSADVVFADQPPPVAGDAGVRLSGNLSAFAVSPWIDYFARLEPGAAQGLDWPALALDIAALDLFGYPISDARLSASGGADWSVRVEAPQLSGELFLPQGYQPRGNTAMVVVVDRADLISGDDTADALLSPLDMPIMDVRLHNFSLDGEQYGRWYFDARPRTDGVSLENLEGEWRRTNINGTLSWRAAPAEQSRFVGRVSSDNLAATLKAWDMPATIESKAVESLLDIRWAGMPTDFDYLALDGTASLEIGPGRFPKTDSRASALRVLGVFNPATMGRRLRLDFSDLYKKGLSFEKISGDFEFDGVLLNTRNLVVASPSGEFRLDGTVNMETETLDHQMQVTLPVSSNLYVGCFAGPIACAGVFVVDRVWGDRLEKMAAVSYRVSGTFDEPKVEEGKRTSK